LTVTTACANPLQTSSAIKMSDDMFRQIRDYIYQLTGIMFQDTKKYLLEGRLSKRLQILSLPNYESYLQLIKFGTRRAEEIKFLYDAVTINETFFFRNEPQFEAFEHTLVPQIVASKRSSGRTNLRVWSAASSSGEEAYTLGMIYLERLKPAYPSLEIEIVGSDINSTVLETARQGIYREYSVRNTPKMFLQKYFKTEDARFYLDDSVKRLAKFQHMNLYDRPKMRLMSKFDIIFCANVLIYFDAKSKIQVVADLYDALNPGGYLFIGYAESLHGISTAFKLINFPKTVAYKKE
jgi:chemotaxis protein methyltransferase CheR